MRKRAFLLLATCCGVPFSVNAQSHAAAPLRSGTYLVGIAALGDTNWFAWNLRVVNDSVRGDFSPTATNTLRGAWRRDSVELVQMWDSSTVRTRFKAKVTDGRLIGLALGNDRNGAPRDTALFLASLQPTRTGPARTVRYEPTVFYRNFSRSIPPALHIFPGDTVQTRTVDAGGADWNGVRRSAGGNPQTGPFYIEGTVPGDVIAIRLHRVRLNRDFARAGTSLVGGAITPAFARALPEVADFDGRWTLDHARGVARMSSPTKAMANFEIPLRPMMGCIAVAPAQRQSIRTADSGPFGGNMDYNELREGTTVYLTVNTPGALVFIGDGHAAQGDGELAGDALETSMDVSFSVDIMRGMSNGAPRAESAEYLMAIGISGDLQEALRMATSDLARWLASDYALNSAELASILGTAMRYDVADMVGAQVSIVAKVPKSVIARIVRER
jgi:amidase